jgi:hypothetical protein
MTSVNTHTLSEVSKCMGEQRRLLAKQFNGALVDFLGNLGTAFPDAKSKCDEIGLKVRAAGTDEELLEVPLERTATHIEPHHLESIAKREESYLLKDAEDVEFLRALNLKETWAEASEETKQSVWEWLNYLAQFVQAYKAARATEEDGSIQKALGAVNAFHAQNGNRQPQTREEWAMIMKAVDPEITEEGLDEVMAMAQSLQGVLGQPQAAGESNGCGAAPMELDAESLGI